MSYIIYDREADHPLRLDVFVRGLTEVTIAEPVQSVRSATEFDVEEDANAYLLRLKESQTYDVSNCEVISLDVAVNIEDKQNEEFERNEAVKAWARTAENVKRNILRKKLKGEGEAAVSTWLEYVKDTSGILPMTDEELLDIKAEEISNRYGITITAEQREELRKRFTE